MWVWWALLIKPKSWRDLSDDMAVLVVMRQSDRTIHRIRDTICSCWTYLGIVGQGVC